MATETDEREWIAWAHGGYEMQVPLPVTWSELGEEYERAMEDIQQAVDEGGWIVEEQLRHTLQGLIARAIAAVVTAESIEPTPTEEVRASGEEAR